jgi:hypothetical protein
MSVAITMNATRPIKTHSGVVNMAYLLVIVRLTPALLTMSWGAVLGLVLFVIILIRTCFNLEALVIDLNTAVVCTTANDQ